MSQFFRFLLVGVANTALGYLVIFGCMYLAGLSPEFSNLIGYAFGLIVSYLLNRNYTFKSLQSRRTEFVRFVLVFLIAYAANFLILVALVRWWDMHAGLSQILAGVIYVCTSYLLNNNYVFRPPRRS
jgi:putative flippase GtrA